jgi:two-component system, OmpR family, sensor histidine kinase VicK
MVAKVLDRAVVQVRKMNRMVTGFLNLSRLEAGKMLITKQLFDLDQLTRELIDESKLIESSHEIVFHSGGKMVVSADQDKISSVISNLISNAIKYSPKEQKIEVTTRLNGSNVEVRVKDYGMGILQQDQKKIFDRYYRVETNRSTAVPGFGVGLYLSAEIIHRHQGQIWVESEIGKGSSFYFNLPMDPRA